MPEVRYYDVQQVREVKVWANSPANAAQVAASVFNGLQQTVEGAPVSKVREIDLLVREDRLVRSEDS